MQSVPLLLQTNLCFWGSHNLNFISFCKSFRHFLSEKVHTQLAFKKLEHQTTKYLLESNDRLSLLQLLPERCSSASHKLFFFFHLRFQDGRLNQNQQVSYPNCDSTANYRVLNHDAALFLSLNTTKP